jgi:uncharacterized membrane protein YjjP (DUF1212 family)
MTVTASSTTASTTSSTQSRRAAWYRPTVSPEHGVYVVLIAAFLIGAAAAQRWTWHTSLALICAFPGFQAEHPLVVQLKQRRRWQPRMLLWGGLYASVSLSLAIYLYGQAAVLLWIYLGAALALAVDGFSVLRRGQKSIANELITFAAVCLCTPLAYAATVGFLTPTVLALWGLNTLFFSSSIFTVKLRKPRTRSVWPGVGYHAIATLLIALLWYTGWLPTIPALAFGIVLLKFGFILLRRTWYQTTRIQQVAMLETITALIFLGVTAISLLPATLL